MVGLCVEKETAVDLILKKSRKRLKGREKTLIILLLLTLYYCVVKLTLGLVASIISVCPVMNGTGWFVKLACPSKTCFILSRRRLVRAHLSYLFVVVAHEDIQMRVY